MYVRGKYLWFGDDLNDCFSIRKKVFVEEQGMSEEDVFDDLDRISVHVIVYDEGDIPVASGRIVADNGEYRIGKIAVLSSARGKKLGDFLVRMLVDKGFVAGADTIAVRSQIHAIKFYEKIGFECSGPIFTDRDNLVVQPMQLNKGGLCKECQGKSCSDCNSK